MKVPYEIHNPTDSEKPWIIMVNGLFASRASWELTKPHLENHFRVLTYDGRGQGEGPRPPAAYVFSELVADLAELVESLGIDKFHLMGISQGARVALKFAELHPHQVLGVIACDTYSEVSPLLRLKIGSWLEAHRKGGGLLRFDVAAPWIWSEELLREKPELYEFYRSRAQLENPKVIERLIEVALEGSVQLEKIACPALYAAGEKDVLTPPESHLVMKGRTPLSDFVLLRGGHASVLEFPEMTSQRLLPHYRRLIEQSQESRSHGEAPLL